LSAAARSAYGVNRIGGGESGEFVFWGGDFSRMARYQKVGAMRSARNLPVNRAG
jgi:hypothetical protein